MSDEQPSAGHSDEQTPNETGKVDALLPAFALRATDADEHDAVVRALAGDPDAAAALGDYAELVELLHYSAEPVSPPPALADRLRASLDAAPAAGPVVPPVVSSPPRRQFQWPLWLASVTAAAILILVLANGWLLYELVGLRSQHAALLQTINNRDMLLADVVSATGEHYRMPAAQEGSNSWADVAWLPGSNVAVLRAGHFPKLTADKVYQFWLIRDGQRTSGGLFTVADDGSGVLVFSPPEPLDNFDGMGVTPEPAGGSSGPTAPPVVFVQF
ncbi:MAG: anti-sigma factor [Caldilineaceae bacterium]|nr:anti-sigma factor [Caldilineaceae bacterium]